MERRPLWAAERRGHVMRKPWTRCVRTILLVVVTLWASAAQPATGATPNAAPAATLGVQEHEIGGVEVALLEVKRTSGDTLTLKWQYRNKSRESKNLTPGDISGYGLAKDHYLIDPVNRKKYLIVKDAENHPVAAHPDNHIGAGQTVTMWAKFPAPPPE